MQRGVAPAAGPRNQQVPRSHVAEDCTGVRLSSCCRTSTYAATQQLLGLTDHCVLRQSRVETWLLGHRASRPSRSMARGSRVILLGKWFGPHYLRIKACLLCTKLPTTIKFDVVM
mmetsp:Transcript_40481/g.89946  ORF Transcript_40481/g.89946 Transcript_40481/m.89946 type:complete len:115 (-) Transcript_40481:429-773(-)